MDDQKPYSKLFASFFDHGTYFPYANGVSSAQILLDLLANEGPRRPKPEPPEEGWTDENPEPADEYEKARLFGST